MPKKVSKALASFLSDYLSNPVTLRMKISHLIPNSEYGDIFLKSDPRRDAYMQIIK